MPTLPHPAPKLPENRYEEGLLKFASRTTGMESDQDRNMTDVYYTVEFAAKGSL
jgi:hypothetical protein